MTTPEEAVRGARLDGRIQPEPNTGCWLWTGSVTSNGYGQVRLPKGSPKVTTMAHRMVWESCRGPIPDDMVLDHICRVRSCVNPDHLRVVTVRENTLCNSVGPTALNTAKTHCPKCGGPYAPHKRKSNERYCPPCGAAVKKGYDAARRPRKGRTSERCYEVRVRFRGFEDWQSFVSDIRTKANGARDIALMTRDEARKFAKDMRTAGHETRLLREGA